MSVVSRAQRVPWRAIAVRMLRSTQIQVQEFANGAPKSLSVRAGCRQVIGVSGDCGRERLQAV